VQVRNIHDSGEAADKTCCKLQHAAMHVTCPQCHATYELKDDVHHALLVCHRCQTEFAMDGMSVSTEPTLSDQKIIPENPMDMMRPAPQRKKARIWPWLTAVLLIIIGLGLQYNQALWQQQVWLRNILIQFHYPLQTQANDWRISGGQSHRQWVTRQDGSRVLMLTGSIQNRLDAPQLPPQLIVQFYDVSNTSPMQSDVVPISMPTNIPQIRHAPYIAPDKDLRPIPAHGQREFTLVFEHVPEQSREISIAVSLK